MTQKITRDQLLEILSRRKGTQLISATWVGDARLKKTGNPHPNCKKRVSANLKLGASYKNALEKAMANSGVEPTSASGIHDAKWGEHIEGTPIIRHTGKDNVERFYLDAIINKVLDTQYEDETGPIIYDEIKEFLPNKDSRLVPVARVCLDNIKTIKINKETYEVV